MFEEDNKKFDLDGRDPNSQPFEKESSLNNEPVEDLNQKRELKRKLTAKVKALSSGEWLLTQEILQEIEAYYLVSTKDSKKPASIKAVDLLKEEIVKRYSEDEELCKLLVESVPNSQNIRRWRQIEGWDDAVWAKLKNNNMFNNQNRYLVMDSMLKKALEGDVSAAKIWLTLSGDYSDKMDINTDKRLEAFREINEVIHKKKEE